MEKIVVFRLLNLNATMSSIYRKQERDPTSPNYTFATNNYLSLRIMLFGFLQTNCTQEKCDRVGNNTDIVKEMLNIADYAIKRV